LPSEIVAILRDVIVLAYSALPCAGHVRRRRRRRRRRGLEWKLDTGDEHKRDEEKRGHSHVKSLHSRETHLSAAPGGATTPTCLSPCLRPLPQLELGQTDGSPETIPLGAMELHSLILLVPSVNQDLGL
jgi:hypothetical protein